MIVFQPEELYYGVVDTEMVQFTIDCEGGLFIKTLPGKSVLVSKENWKQKGAFFGAGKLDCSMRYKSQQIQWQIRIYPLKERDH